jgi:hypothetical protein
VAGRVLENAAQRVAVAAVEAFRCRRGHAGSLPRARAGSTPAGGRRPLAAGRPARGAIAW